VCHQPVCHHPWHISFTHWASLLPNAIIVVIMPQRPQSIVISSDEEEGGIQWLGTVRTGRVVSELEGVPYRLAGTIHLREGRNVEGLELEDLRRRCHELEQVCSSHCRRNPTNKRDSHCLICLNFLGTRCIEE
jgi:hypothetical protein